MQVPNDTLRRGARWMLYGVMADEFREALIWHMDHHGTGIAQLVAATGVSRDVVNKLRSRPGSSTTVENALLIASFYGKTVNQFVARQAVTLDDQLQTLIDMLEPEARRILAAQVRGLLAEAKAS